VIKESPGVGIYSNSKHNLIIGDNDVLSLDRGRLGYNNIT